MRRLLLISNSTMHGRSYLDHVRDELQSFLTGVGELLFVPWALADHDAYAAKAISAFAPLGIRVRSLHTAPDVPAAIQSAEAVFVGGGNTFRLLHRLQQSGAAPALTARAMSGMRYVGSSAGTGIAAPTIRTTNDMPIVEPQSLASLALVPFQINAHYLDPDLHSTHMGETREERLRQFHEENAAPVLGLREGGWLVVDGSCMELRGNQPARLFVRGHAPTEYAPPFDLSFLLSKKELR
ncbi:MAG: dipeptidase PepE [Planctomycetes bacterium]|nr:dipeptidase PepE [Planctomycetota bacterium]